MYKTFAKHLLAIAFIIYLIAAILVAILALAGGFGFVLGFLVIIAAGFVLQAALVKAVQDVRDGGADLSIGETLSAVAPSLLPVLGASILSSIGFWIGFWFLLVPGLYLMTIWAVIVPVIVIERSGALGSFERSRRLVRGRGWHVFATLVLVNIILYVVVYVLSLIFSALPFGLDNGLSSVIAGTVVSPYLALVVALVYYRLVGSSVAAGDAGPYGGYQQQPPPPVNAGYGGYGQPPQGGDPWSGYGQPPPCSGYGQPPPGSGYGQPPPGGWAPPTQQVPRPDSGWAPPAQQVPRPDEDWPPPPPPQPPR
jgi:hypothetical protein